MSCIAVDGGPADVCANCGMGSGGEGGVKLRDCTACRLVKYCGVDCQRAHRRQHKKACKQRAAELKDEQLYCQGLERPEDNDADSLAMIRVRVAKKDPAAIYFLGNHYSDGKCGLQKDMRKAVDLWTEAAELGTTEALFHLGVVYNHGEGVQKDKAKAAEFYMKATMQGHVMSRCNLGHSEAEKGKHKRAVRHFLISAKMGHKRSVENIKGLFIAGLATKEQYAEALKGYQDAVEEMKSHDRDEASALRKS
ncbi:hypothetical protein THAOC_20958 [Thalassiosira oceanica]|uniref:MYND-type domain-containing protein n=1 Tax=Thalassiosira oceanica TaxID=159749 RepID=K0RYL3_THAOC|nr:hypothetical protein THAOC_20958 [Thalassiosira oceanica]|eukprot:EJK58883.1 hypothetical protein THAOC_20958 [Thalassiosira oceanica]